LLAILGAIAIAAPAAADIELKASSALTTNREMTQAYIKYFLNALNEQGKGMITTHFVGGPEVTPPTKQAAALARGAFDITHSPSSYYAGTVPEGYAVLVTNMTPAEIRASGGFAMLDAAHQKKANAKLLAWGDAGGKFNTYLAKKPIMAADGSISLKGFKMRSTATYRPLFEYLGATPVGMKSSEIFTGLERGVVHGFGSPSSGLIAIGVKGKVKYRVDPSYYNLNNFVFINLDRWKALPEKARTLIDRVARTYEDKSTEFYLGFANKDEKEMKAAGMEIITLAGKAARDYVGAANAAVWERFAKVVGEEEIAKYKKAFIK
jgi:TRAP-type C4-dicarboxylate transport system substrate-binding protein